jgi:hypothetical protein
VGDIDTGVENWLLGDLLEELLKEDEFFKEKEK